MATKGKIVRNEHRKAVVARYAVRRAELKAIIARPTTPEDERVAARRELARACLVGQRRREAGGGRPGV